MTASPGLFTLTRRRFATPRSAALVIVALTLLAAFVISAAPRALVGVVRDEVAHQISDVPATSRDLTARVIGVPAFGPATDPAVTEGWDAAAVDVFGTVGQALADNRETFEPALQGMVAPAQFAGYAEAFQVDPADLDATAPFSAVQLLAEPWMQSALELADGAWPAPWSGTGPVEIVLSEEAAATMQWPVGEVRGTPMPRGERRVGAPADATPSVDDWMAGDATLVLSGTVKAADAEADRWLHLPTALTATVFDDGNRRPTATSVAWVDPASWAQVAAVLRAYLQAWYPVDASAATHEDPRELLSALRAATSTPVAFDATGQLRMRFESEIVDVLSSAVSRADSASAILAVAAVGPLAVSIALVVLASALIIRRRRTDLALMWARGAPLDRLRRLLATEGLLLGVPAAIAGAVIGVLATPRDAGPLPVAIAVLVGAVPALALAFTLRPATLTRDRADLDAPVRSRATGILQLVVILLAGLAVTQLVVRGVGRGTSGIDPLVIIAPLLATVALALIIVRLHPVPIAAALRVARRGRGVVGLVGAARNLRDPAAGTTAVLAMLVAVAIAVFSSVVLATVDHGATVAAERAVGADIQLSGPVFDQATVDELGAVDGVADAVGVMRGDYLAMGGTSGRGSVLAIVSDTARLAQVQRGMTGALPAGLIHADTDPAELIVSSTVAAETGTDGFTVGSIPAEVVGTMDRFLGLSTGDEFAVVDVSAYTALSGRGWFPRSVFVSLEAGADARNVAATLSDVVGQGHTVKLLEDSTAEIQASPAVTALRWVLFAALGLAIALSVIAVLLVAGVSQEGRTRIISLLRAMGLDRRRSRGIVAWEFAPLGVTALVGGILLGAVLPLLVVLSIDLRPFTGGGAQPSLIIDPVLSGALIAVVVVALALAVVVGIVGARTTSLADVLRTEED
ncbi:MAG TPA: FtsX-like permease family protein [Microbacterium sp.]|nr:FtsX-like permease family protein [Microbacterium sp.]